VQAASVKEGVQLGDETAGTTQHDGTASIEVSSDDTLFRMCLPEVLPMYSMKPDQSPYSCTSYSTCFCLCPVTQHSHPQLCCSPQLLAVLQAEQSAASASTNMTDEEAGPVMQPSATNNGQEVAQEQEVASSSGSAAANPVMPASSSTSTANSQQVGVCLICAWTQLWLVQLARVSNILLLSCSIKFLPA